VAASTSNSKQQDEGSRARSSSMAKTSEDQMVPVTSSHDEITQTQWTMFDFYWIKFVLLPDEIA
jgi:hypothetical protein